MKSFLLAILGLALVNTKMPQELIDKYQVEYLEGGEASQYPAQGAKADVHYTGTLLNGKKFDSSRDRNQPFVFTVGKQQVIRCWDDIVSHMSPGDKVNVICPASTAYGSQAMGPIPANSDLKFEIEMNTFY